MGGFQLVWWWHRWWRLWPRSVGPYPPRGPWRGKIYAWRVVFGPLEVRKWHEK